METDRDEIRRLLIECLQEVLEDERIFEFIETTDPINDLGLDSLDGVSIACSLSQKLNCYIPLEVNPLINDEEHRPRCIGEIIDLLGDLLKKDQEVSHGQN